MVIDQFSQEHQLVTFWCARGELQIISICFEEGGDLPFNLDCVIGRHRLQKIEQEVEDAVKEDSGEDTALEKTNVEREEGSLPQSGCN